MLDRKNYSLELNGVRGLAALWVVFFHLQYGFNTNGTFFYFFFSHPFIQKGYLAVDTFFILSGFVLSLTSDFWNGKGIISFSKDFLWRRFARIYPLHLVTTLFMAIVFCLQANAVSQSGLFTSFLANIGLVQAWGRRFSPELNFPTWSLSTELLAYLLFPSLFLICRRWFSTTFSCVFGIIAAATGLVFFSYKFTNGSLDMTAEWGWVRCLSEFWIGLFLFNFCKVISRTGKIYFGLGIFTLALILTGLMPWPTAKEFAVIPFSVGLILLCESSIPAFQWALNNKISQFFGNISYSLYLLHVPIGLNFLKLWGSYFGESHSILNGALALTSSLLLLIIASTASHFYFEKWAQRSLLRMKVENGNAVTEKQAS